MLMAWGKWRANRAFLQGDLSRAAVHLKNNGQQCDRRLAAKLTRALVDRADRNMVGGNLPAAWRDLAQASEIALPKDQDWLSRQKSHLVELTIEAADACLSHGKITQTLALVQELEARQILDWRNDRIARTARLIQSADDSAARGHVKASCEQLSMAKNLRPDLGILDARQKANEHRRIQLEQLSRKLEKALLKNDWSKVDQFCNEILVIAPNYQIALDARRRWLEQQQQEARQSAIEIQIANQPVAIGDDPDSVSSRRFLVWVDGVGGFLVCPATQNMIGAALPQAHVEIPVMGDLRRRHARIDRINGEHVVVPLSDAGRVIVDNRKLHEPAPLITGQVIDLDGGVRLRYDQTHPLSSTARLMFESRHRTQPWSDGVILASDSILLGPDRRNHIWCPRWSRNIVLFQRNGQWHCRAEGRYQIDGRSVRDEATLGLDSKVVGPDFAFALEEVSEKLEV